jgi:hypothetical protein
MCALTNFAFGKSIDEVKFVDCVEGCTKYMTGEAELRGCLLKRDGLSYLRTFVPTLDFEPPSLARCQTSPNYAKVDMELKGASET